jgi:hypothetical protein
MIVVSSDVSGETVDEEVDSAGDVDCVGTGDIVSVSV